MRDETPVPFSALAASGDPPLDRLLLALAAEFHAVEQGAALDELDELSRPLFGVEARSARAAGERIATALAYEARLRPVTAAIDGLFFDRVLRTAKATRPCSPPSLSRSRAARVSRSACSRPRRRGSPGSSTTTR